jgi:hypothetical protein
VLYDLTHPTSAPTATVQKDTSEQLMDSVYLAQKYGDTAAAVCDSQADDYVKSVARYDYKWDSRVKGFAPYDTKPDAPGILSMGSSDLRLQNGFGAYQHVVIVCDYSTQTGEVRGFEIEQ